MNNRPLLSKKLESQDQESEMTWGLRGVYLRLGAKIVMFFVMFKIIMFSVPVLCTETQDGVETQGQVREQSYTPLTQDNAEQKKYKKERQNSYDYVTAEW